MGSGLGKGRVLIQSRLPREATLVASLYPFFVYQKKKKKIHILLTDYQPRQIYKIIFSQYIKMKLSTNKNKKIFIFYFFFASLSITYSLLLPHYHPIVKRQTILYIFYRFIFFFILQFYSTVLNSIPEIISRNISVLVYTGALFQNNRYVQVLKKKFKS